MTVKQLLLPLVIIIGTVQICHAQQWVYNSSGTEIKGSYRYASLTSGANDNPRSSSIYINYYNLDQKYNIYLYEITGLECSENTIEYFTDTNESPQSFTVLSKSDGIETIAMTEIEDLSAFLNTVQNASLLTISIKNSCGTGRDILFPMENAIEAITFMTPSLEKVQEQESSPIVKQEQSKTISGSKMVEIDARTEEVQEQVSNIKQEQSTSASTLVPDQTKKTMSSSQGSNIDAEWARLTKRNKELDRKDSLLVVFQAQLDERELALIQKEQQLEEKAKEAQNASVVSTPEQSSSTDLSPTIVQSTSYPYRYVQFVATSAGRSYDQLSYIGQIVSEQIPGRNITRYKVMGQWSDADVARVKNQLAQEGFQGAFESR